MSFDIGCRIRETVENGSREERAGWSMSDGYAVSRANQHRLRRWTDLSAPVRFTADLRVETINAARQAGASPARPSSVRDTRVFPACCRLS